MRLCPVLSIVATLTACSQAETPAPVAEHGSAVIFVGAATDEALERLLDLEPEQVTSERWVIESPQSGVRLARDAPQAISWRRAGQAQSSPRSAPESSPSGSLNTRSARLDRGATSQIWTELLAFVRPIGVAHAHGTPFNGTGFYLVIQDANAQPWLRVFTDQTSYTPEASDWSALGAAAQPLRVSVLSAIFEQNEVAADGGPFLGDAVEFGID